MIFTNHDLKQVDYKYLANLPIDKLLNICFNFFQDLLEARDRLNQTPLNSSRPPASFPPWQAKPHAESPTVEESLPQGPERGQTGNASTATVPTQTNEIAESTTQKKESAETTRPSKETEKKKPGKQAGAQGHGRQVELPITDVQYHRACECVACGEILTEESLFEARGGLYVLDVEIRELGLEVTHVKHLYGYTHCSCGHITLTEPGRCQPEEGWQVQLSEWHLVGPTLASLIICLALRMRLSRRRIQELLSDWLSIKLSVGVINQTITEGGRACEPIEEQLIEEIRQSELLHADETGWKENGRLVWLWVLVTVNTTLFMIGSRSWDVIADALDGFAGWLMSDGYISYRRYAKRLRCLAHLIRKARGLSESLDGQAQQFGERTLAYISGFISEIYAARAGPEIDLSEKLADELANLKEWCEAHRDSTHQKTKALARELLYDWDAIWSVLVHPALPISNNRAEQALRHWIIMRKISFGTRTKEGSRAFALLASVIETCRQRGISPWTYLAQVIAQRRKGNPAPPLPTA